MVGQCGLTWQDCGRESPVLEVGYLLEKAAWHKGYATEAAQACRNYAFEQLGAAEVFSIIRDNNLPSQAVARRNGMEVRGQFVKHLSLIHIYTLPGMTPTSLVPQEAAAVGIDYPTLCQRIMDASLEERKESL